MEGSVAAAPSTIGVLVKPVRRTAFKLALEQAIDLSAAAPIGPLRMRLSSSRILPGQS